MIPLYPKSDRERKARNLAAATSFEVGEVPFLRHVGLPLIVDITRAPAPLQAVVTAAVTEAAKDVADCKVKEVSLSFDSDGYAVYKSKVE